jgi:hypothetical protein
MFTGTKGGFTRARIFHESLAATTDMAVLPGVLGCRLLRRTVQVHLGTNTLWLPGGTPIFVVSRQQFMKYPGVDCFSNHTSPQSFGVPSCGVARYCRGDGGKTRGRKKCQLSP